MNSYNELLLWLGYAKVSDEYSFVVGVASMALLILLLVTLAFSFRTFLFFRGIRSTKGLLVKTPQGEMLVTSSALRDFVSIELKSISDIKLLKTKLVTKGSSFNLLIVISAPQHTNIPKLTGQIQSCLEQSIKDQLGIDSSRKIEIQLKKFHTSSRSQVESIEDYTMAESATEAQEDSN